MPDDSDSAHRPKVPDGRLLNGGSDTRIQKLRNKQQQLQAQINDLMAREREQARKEDTRRKVIIGALALEHMEKNKTSTFAQTLWPLLDEYVTRPQDRALLNAYFMHVGLEELPPPSNEGDVTKEPALLKKLQTQFPKSSTASAGRGF